MRTSMLTNRDSFTPYDEIFIWIGENIKGKVTYDSSHDKCHWIWYFDNPQEATLFALRWS